jgi:hypothetical protein
MKNPEAPKNLQDLTSNESHGFLVGMTRRRNSEAESLIDRVDESQWIDCPMGINAQEKKKDPPRTRVQEVECDREGCGSSWSIATNVARTKNVNAPKRCSEFWRG